MKQTNVSPQSVGGKAWGKIQRSKAIDNYYRNPNICLNCKSVINITEKGRVSEIRKKKFCNRSCSATYNNAKHPKRVKTSKTLYCFSCKSVIEVYRSPNRKYCDSCLQEIRQRGVSIEKLTKGELFQKRRNYQTANSNIRTHARKVYLKSSKPKKCIVCNYSKHYEIAHLKSVSEFEDNALIIEINDINNLEALCPNHHWEYDNDLIKLSNLTELRV